MNYGTDRFQRAEIFAGGIFLLRLLLSNPFMAKHPWFLLENHIYCSTFKITKKIFVSEM